MNLVTLKDTHDRLQKAEVFLDFQKEHPDAYLAHAFIMADQDAWSEWQLGYYLKGKDTISTFFMDDEITQSPASEIFKKDKRPLGGLELDKVNFTLDKALEKARALLKKDHAGEIITKTLVILQTLEQGQVFNITFVSQAFNTINVKLATDSLDVKQVKKQSLLDMGKSLSKAS
ncbi:MAG: hypothetical protein GXP63_03985 [DPANN group archaeon]|nr:hypothetical protein [DPANN group archaeon]